jgi:uncharacterized protein
VSVEARLESRSASLVERVAEFCRALRERGVLATPAESVEAVRALERIDLTDRADVYHALRLLLTTRREDLAIFDELFATWWRASPDDSPTHARRPGAPRDHRSRPPQPATRSATSHLSMTAWAPATDAEEGEMAIPAPSTAESRGSKDFASFGNDELDDITRLAARLARRLDTKPSRRWKAAPRRSDGVRIDIRRTVRLSLKTGGDLVELAHRERKRRRTSLVALCDVSGSMDLYSRFLLQFLYALQHAFARVESFAFSTRLLRITRALAGDSYRAALDELARAENGWSGGTKIGASIAEFVERYARLIDKRTVVIVLSDGWDTGEPQVLGDALAAIHRRARRVVWLNPLLGSPNYQPLTRGMQAALPHIDVFAAAHNLASLEALTRHLAL